ncbi:MAG: hypothetical protein LBK61_08965 [Spirochaetaceae bacterium]|jgi:hypothetical protein|nr:hypothetical protein [Spirochaetaceae bacterium]
MYGITRTKVVLCLFVFAAVSSVASTQERTRGIYIDFGLGFGGISYLNGDTKSIVDEFKRTAETRVSVDVDAITIGWALRDNLYLVGTAAGFGDEYFDESNDSNLTLSIGRTIIPMYGLGFRWYPLQSKKHLQLGCDVGISGMEIFPDALDTSDDMIESRDMSLGFSQRVSVGWDFDSTLTGFAAILGGGAMFNIIEGDFSVSYVLFAKLAFKGGRKSPR